MNLHSSCRIYTGTDSTILQYNMKKEVVKRKNQKLTKKGRISMAPIKAIPQARIRE